MGQIDKPVFSVCYLARVADWTDDGDWRYCTVYSAEFSSATARDTKM